MKLEDLGYIKTKHSYTKSLGKFQIEVIVGSTYIIRKIVKSGKLAAIDKFRDISEVESDSKYRYYYSISSVKKFKDRIDRGRKKVKKDKVSIERGRKR